MALIPSPINKLIGIALALPKILKLVKRMVKPQRDSEGKMELGIFIAIGGVAAAPLIAKARKKANDVRDSARLALIEKQKEVSATVSQSTGVAPEDMTEEMNDAIALAGNLQREIAKLANEVPMSREEVEAIIKTEIEKLKPPLLAALTPLTAMIGIPVFLMELMKYMEAADPYTAAGLQAMDKAPPLVPAGNSLTRDSSEDPLPKYAEWGSPPDEKSPIKKKNAQGRKVKWWWTVPPQLPAELGEGDWTRNQFGGLGSKDAHKRFMERRYDQ